MDSESNENVDRSMPRSSAPISSLVRVPEIAASTVVMAVEVSISIDEVCSAMANSWP